nr:hypothetical protein [Bacilli bacterium]
MKLNNNARILIISDKDYFSYLFSYKNKHPEFNIKIINRNTLLDKLAYRFTSDPIPYLIKEKGISYSKAKRYINLLRLGVHQNNPKLNSLYSDISSMLTKDEYGLYELEQYEIYLFEMDEDRDVIHLLNNNKL